MNRIERYGLIGDMQTRAHAAADGSLDWLCLPRFDSAAVFAALFGTQKHGARHITPTTDAAVVGPTAAAERRHRGDSLVLESGRRTLRGTARVIGFMPPRDRATQVIRIVKGVAGEVPMASTPHPRPGVSTILTRF
ncbi:trehalase-like domain-containing protein [Streptomyces cathayae]|uniref:DUF5911 domain-containing protein n=1 Tax=Streptomyces cathayae TaxID=3031124 RepID=A0ABY8JUP3_9ACTN|nr:trehalase-like domain-containing protein [Streptomyces sp. HUAS 5]WGD39709.1 DUF5911 domain-containing protein [Streptomyces sp. HUAS 5]